MAGGGKVRRNVRCSTFELWPPRKTGGHRDSNPEPAAYQACSFGQHPPPDPLKQSGVWSKTDCFRLRTLRAPGSGLFFGDKVRREIAGRACRPG